MPIISPRTTLEFLVRTWKSTSQDTKNPEAKRLCVDDRGQAVDAADLLGQQFQLVVAHKVRLVNDDPVCKGNLQARR